MKKLKTLNLSLMAFAATGVVASTNLKLAIGLGVAGVIIALARLLDRLSHTVARERQQAYAIAQTKLLEMVRRAESGESIPTKELPEAVDGCRLEEPLPAQYDPIEVEGEFSTAVVPLGLAANA